MVEAKIHDLGYRAYEGDRAGLGWAMANLGLHAVQRSLGLKRAFRHKVLPAIVILIAFVPAIVFVGLAAFLPEDLLEEDILPSYGDYYGFILMAIFLFSSFVAPEALCTDRRTGMLALYLASPIDRTTYVISKVAAVASVLLTITLLPELFLLGAYTIEGAGPDGFINTVETLVRILAAGALVAAFFAAFSSAMSSFTSRRGIASASIVLALLIPPIVVNSILESTDAADEWGLLNTSAVPFRAAQWLLADVPEGTRGLQAVGGSLATLATAAFATLFAGFTWWRYQTVAVEG